VVRKKMSRRNAMSAMDDVGIESDTFVFFLLSIAMVRFLTSSGYG
jgi:hypothetical protein